MATATESNNKEVVLSQPLCVQSLQQPIDYLITYILLATYKVKPATPRVAVLKSCALAQNCDTSSSGVLMVFPWGSDQAFSMASLLSLHAHSHNPRHNLSPYHREAAPVCPGRSALPGTGCLLDTALASKGWHLGTAGHCSLRWLSWR